jgi:hypothetical protein
MQVFLRDIVVDKLVTDALTETNKRKMPIEQYKKDILGVYAEIINSVHSRLPNLSFKDIALGCLLSRSKLLLPEYVETGLPGGDVSGMTKDQLLNALATNYDIRTITTAKGITYREDQSKTILRLSNFTKLLTGLLTDDAHIGNLFALLINQINTRFHWLSSVILESLLQIGGERLL